MINNIKYKVGDIIIHNRNKYEVVDVYHFSKNDIDDSDIDESYYKLIMIFPYKSVDYTTFSVYYLDLNSSFDVKNQRKLKLKKLYDNTTMVK